MENLVRVSKDFFFGHRVLVFDLSIENNSQKQIHDI